MKGVVKACHMTLSHHFLRGYNPVILPHLHTNHLQYLHEVFGEGREGRRQDKMMEPAMFLWSVVTEVHKVLNIVMGVEVQQLLRGEGSHLTDSVGIVH